MHFGALVVFLTPTYIGDMRILFALLLTIFASQLCAADLPGCALPSEMAGMVVDVTGCEGGEEGHDMAGCAICVVMREPVNVPVEHLNAGDVTPLAHSLLSGWEGPPPHGPPRVI
ncbi:hypothetical protein [Halocynthiibacter styelae]|uniref:DUF2946 domain-containing protein n=1 Tax=Halocynthiibacter styelae TaxID=2761955 RepID=A0A8J7IPY6_9RHOB|nr:hypothetical protein [Paenihalocynthiibacter styelae]MBI1493101.1 hypothetical protein [Paenihalocynthiibacter styelae]